MISPANAPDYCTFVLIGSLNDAMANVTGRWWDCVLQLGHQFFESMTTSAAIENGILPPAGIYNLGNTCYANSVIQVLHMIPELKERLKAVPADAIEHGTPAAIAQTLNTTFTSMENSSTAVKPLGLIGVSPERSSSVTCRKSVAMLPLTSVSKVFTYNR